MPQSLQAVKSTFDAQLLCEHKELLSSKAWQAILLKAWTYCVNVMGTGGNTPSEPVGGLCRLCRPI